MVRPVVVFFRLGRSMMLGASMETRRSRVGTPAGSLRAGSKPSRARTVRSCTLRWSVCAIGLLAGGACYEPQPPPEGERGVPISDSVLESPMEASGDLCMDVGGAYVCWGDGLSNKGCDGDLCVTPRTTPAAPPIGGWRCSGQGDERICRPRYPASSHFRCSGDTCIQDYPRFPDDGVWECGDRAGVSHCRRGYKPSGVVMGPPDPGWLCNEGEDGHSVCLDFAPDTPNGETDGWECHYQHGDSVQRLCRRNAVLPRVGARCRGGCPLGARCVEDFCVPKRPNPNCWLDADCKEGSCLFGTCDATVSAPKNATPMPTDDMSSGHH